MNKNKIKKIIKNNILKGIWLKIEGKIMNSNLGFVFGVILNENVVGKMVNFVRSDINIFISEIEMVDCGKLVDWFK